MDNICLALPKIEDEMAAMDFIKESIVEGKHMDGGAGIDSMLYTNWVAERKKAREGETIDGYVPSTTFFAKDKNGDIVGIIDIRHFLNEYLKNYGGHIGYLIRPTKRGKGYGSQMLLLALEECKKMGIETLLLTTDDDNVASQQVMLHNDAKLIKKDLYEGKLLHYYEIEVK